MRSTFLSRTTVASLALAACALRAGAQGPEPAGGAVPFFPTPAGAAGAFLIAGPFDGPQPEIEEALTAREGDPLPGGREWRFELLTGRFSVLRMGEPGGRGVFYVRGDFLLDGPGERVLVVSASCRAAVWAAGRPAVNVIPHARKEIRLEAERGELPVLVRLEARGAPVALVLGLLREDAAGRFSPERALLRLSDAGAGRLGGLLEGSLKLRLRPALAREGGDVAAELFRVGACPDVGGRLRVGFRIRPRGKIRFAAEGLGGGRELSLAELVRKPAGTRFYVGAGAPGQYELTAEITRDGEPFARVRASGYVAEGIRRWAGEIERRARAASEGEKGPPSALAYALLQAEKARLTFSRGRVYYLDEALGRDLDSAEVALREAAEGRDFQAGRVGFMERAYFSEVDESVQPYLVYVPTGCAKGTGPWPLVVYLHGYVPSYDKHAWLTEDAKFNAVMEAEGCILAVPFGRSNTDFRNVGEDDVLRVIEEMKRVYPVDPRRIYLYGYSMGGLGVWTMLCHYPDKFAAAVIVSGQSDFYLWHKLDRELVPAWRRHLIETDNPMDLAENIRHVPVRAYHGGGDYVVSPEHSKRMIERLKDLGADAELHIIEGGSHWCGFDEVFWKREPVEWMKQHSLPEEPPEEFTLIARHPRYARAWGVSVYAFRRWMEPADLRVKREGEHLRLALRNADEINLFPKLAGHVHRDQLQLEARDGARYVLLEADGAVGYFNATTKKPMERRGLLKEEWLCGPVKEAFRSPFCVVYGTVGTAEQTAELGRNAERFVKEWRDFAKGRPPMFADTEVTAEIAKAKNLILFGEADTNAIISRIADKLPIKWDRTQAEIAGQGYSLENRGLLFVYPNPESSGRLVVVFSGLYWGGHLSVNHKWDHVPDFILFEDEIDTVDPQDPLNRPVVAGFFGPDWSLEKGKIFAGERALRDAEP